MVSVPVRSMSGQDVGSYEFDLNEIASGVNRQLLHDAVVMYESNRRVGTSKTKSRGQVKGSTKKLFRQKGTGRARAGASRTPVRRGGGHTFGKSVLDWTFRLPKKAVKQATRMALLSKFQDDEVTMLDGLSVEGPRTKVIADMLKSLGLSATDCLLVVDGHDANVWVSSKNIPTLRVSPASDLNAYDLLRMKQLLITTAAMDSLRGGRVAVGVEE
jgi:large subunit ribosomal protein L4